MGEEAKVKRPRRTREERVAALDEKIKDLIEDRDAKIAKHKAVFDQKAGEITEAYASKIAAVEEQKRKLQWPDEIQKLLKKIPKDMSPEEIAKRLGILEEDESETDENSVEDSEESSEDTGSDSENSEW